MYNGCKLPITIKIKKYIYRIIINRCKSTETSTLDETGCRVKYSYACTYHYNSVYLLHKKKDITMHALRNDTDEA